ncbi:MAG: molybdopterin-dependent oxidoreductase [Hoeflea sp.]|uniref:xanthine dehydrogenase family protein molybdopterin-binding subunit n=1 Tax=Hoeflea sp. TaxID=1940281 RepID=UPI001DD5934A|nr:molybdopterin cofactor-binding domain-containing protein [Hoeflea sp.]MBU4529990.1 molybdopterin-dependent oxidoreductase [Alphaproteobacteria bacterium]MBU4543217.1 molybdopterin-dependent oxidoreductase [Alphaproteobacteria bacterium]MBU4550243.1 molybdopterin-dependent oxidoreductase [Alphaproteobacteria bacterium]MBV1722483.1 molybdopterin-dependent oxidoreductase [Hoeflea sp.]MBV1761633.1 molybdopterin-dependent oxidoreductase [Hoeflea sp.]
MSRLKTITRRGFLIGSVALAGGVAFGAYMVTKPHANPLLEGAGQGDTAITPYVLINADGVTLITPRADKGQGAYSVQAALIAEELDVELDQIRVDPGPPSPAYWNTALADEAAAFMVPSGGRAERVAHGVLSAVMKTMGMQITGGSTTVPDGFMKLRQAGAVARETLKLAAAQKTGTAMADLRTEAGRVILPDGSSLSYMELAPIAADITPPQEIALREPSEWRLIGKPMRRIDIVAKSTGTQNFGIDHKVDGMVHAAIVLNPAQGGPMNSFDASEALTMRGVRDVVQITGGVAVIADNTWRAFQAASAIRFDWGPAPFPATMDAHWETLSNSFTEEFEDSRQRDDGDVDISFAESAGLISAEYRAPYLAHAPLEPLSAIVRIDNDAAEVWTGTQVPRFIQKNVGRIAGIEADKVTVHALYMGGSFGHRLEDEVVKQAAEIAVKMKGTPVKLTYSREQDMTHDFPRQIAMARMRGVVRNGQVDSYDLGIAMPSVVMSQMARQELSVPGPDSQIVAGAWDQPFAIPNHRVTGYRALQLAPISSWRSVGASSNGFFYNAGLDELIHAAGADPLTERIRLCDDDEARKVLEAVGEMSGWDGVLGDGRGRGVALTQSFGVHCAQVVEVTSTDAGIRIEKVWVAAEVGTVIDPVNFDNLVKGGVLFGLGHAMNCEITYTDGIADQSNFDTYEGMRMHQCPVIEVRGLENGARVLGIGEPPVPPAAPALAGAIFAATGTRLREMPFSKFVDFA